MHHVFQDIDQDMLEIVRAKLQPFHFKPGEVIFNAGETPKGLYIIEEGLVEILPPLLGPRKTQEIKLRKGPGEYFGEMSLMDRRQHDAEVFAFTELKGFLLPRDVFDKLVENTPSFLRNLIRQILSQLRSQDTAMIRELSQAKSAAEKVIERMKVLNNTSRVLNSTLDLDRLLEMILDEATRNTDCDTGTIYLLESEKNELVSKFVQGDTIEVIRLPVGLGIAGTVAQTREVINIEDAYSDERFNQEIDKRTGYRTRNLLTFPMQSERGNVVGVLQLLNKKSGPFTLEDEAFIEAMSLHASIAIEKARLVERMIKSENLAVVGRFAASVVHDFRTPMTVIKGYSTLLRTKSQDEEAEEYLQTIENQVSRMAGMTREVLDYSRDEMLLQITDINLHDMLENTIRIICNDCKKSISVKLINSKPDLHVRCDSDKLARVIQNLTNNACDAMPDGGKLTVTLRTGKESWILEVKDTGKGIPADRLESIFDPFVSYEKAHGTGLGLAIVRKVVEGHKGSIEVESEIGKGTVFKLTVPFDPES